MTPERAFAGGTVLTISAAGATTAYALGCPLVGHLFVVLGFVGLTLTFAKWLPGLHRLPLVGAIPLPKIEFHLEAPPGGMEFEMDPTAEARVLLCAGVLPEGRREEITRVTLNAHVVGAINIERTKQDANPYPSGGTRLQGPDGPYWSHYPMTIPLGAFLMFFKVTIPEPGEYEVVLTLQSPDFRDKGDHFYRGTLTARATGNAMSDPDVRDQLRRLYADDVATVEGLLGFADRLFARLELLARKQDGIVGAEVARATKMLRAGLLLCENGYGEQAAMVCRSMFESMAVCTGWSPTRTKLSSVSSGTIATSACFGRSRSSRLVGPTRMRSPRSSWAIRRAARF